MKHINISTLLLGSLLLTGCYTVPATKISVDPKTHTFSISSPKDTKMADVTVTVDTNRAISVNIGSYSSENNSLVLKAINDANIESQKNIISGLEKITAAAAGIK